MDHNVGFILTSSTYHITIFLNSVQLKTLDQKGQFNAKGSILASAHCHPRRHIKQLQISSKWPDIELHIE